MKKRLVIFTGVNHFDSNQGVKAHSGFVKEINLWAKIFNEVLIISPLASTKAILKGDEICYAQSNVKFDHLISTLYDTKNKWGKALRLCQLFVRTYNFVKKEDVLMARGPDVLCMLPILIARVKGNKLIGKYADQWTNYIGELFSYKIQKSLFRSSIIFKGRVQMYGEKDESRPHLVPFFASGINKANYELAKSYIKDKQNNKTILYVGRYYYNKGVDVLIEGFSIFLVANPDFKLKMFGAGDMKDQMLDLIDQYGITDKVEVNDWIGREQLFFEMSQATIFVHSSRKEGFGKVLIEAMNFELPIIGADVGVSRHILGKDYPFFYNPNQPHSLAELLDRLANDEVLLSKIGKQLRKRIHDNGWYMENLENKYRSFLKEYIGV